MWNNNYGVTQDFVRDFMYKVYGWMASALTITGVVAYFVAENPVLFKTLTGSPLAFVLIFAQIGVVWFLSAQITKMEYATALTSFVLYSVLSGCTFSVFFYMYTMASLYKAFFMTAGTFFAMALYGYVTKTDLTSLGSYMVMALFGLIITSVVNIWFQSPVVEYYMSLFGIGIFMLLTAYDSQKIKQMAYAVRDQEMSKKVALLGSLVLYLDFINLFIYILQITGQRKRQ